MVRESGFLSSDRCDHAHVERTMLIEEVDIELARCGAVILCAPWGYGRTDLLHTYARIVHAKTPMRPIVKVDFNSYEAQAYLAGNARPLDGRLSREARSALWLIDSCGGSGLEKMVRPDMSDGGGFEGGPGSAELGSSPAVRLVYNAARVLAPGWMARLERGSRFPDLAFGEMPLIVLDNLPRLEEVEVGEFAAMVKAWVQSGARILMACAPAALIPSYQLPEAHVIPAARLGVSRDELQRWAADLHLAQTGDLETVTGGVPLLVDAVRAVLERDPLMDESYLGAVDRVVDRCLDEPLCESGRNARCAMLILGEGRLDDLAAVGASIREDELGILAESFPLLGIDRLGGGFRCVPFSTGRGSRTFEKLVSINEALSERCVGLLVAQRKFARAGDVASMLSDGVRLRLYGQHPDAFADAAHDEAIARSLRSASLGGQVEDVLLASMLSDGVRLRLYGQHPDAFADAAHDEAIARSLRSASLGGQVEDVLLGGIGRLARMHAIGHDLPMKLLVPGWGHIPAGPAEGALKALQTVIGYWRGFGLNASAALTSLDGGECVANEVPGDAFDRRTNLAEGELYDIDTVVHTMGSSALKGSIKAFREQWRRLEGLVGFSRSGLEQAVYASHVALCGFICGDFEAILAWLEPMAMSCAELRRGPRIESISDALLSALCAAARLLVEKPLAPGVSDTARDVMFDARQFFSERDIGPGKALMALLEAACALLDGRERPADAALRICQARWGLQGVLIGQYAVAIGLSISCFACEAVNQALVHAQTAELLANKLGLQRGVWLARLLQSVATVQTGVASDVDRRLLEATLRQTSLYPRVSHALNIELAVLYAAVDDANSARDVLQGIALSGKPALYRFLIAIVRALGKERSMLLGLLPRDVRREYEHMRPTRSPCPGDRKSAVWTEATLATGQVREEAALKVNLFGGLRVTANGYRIPNTQWGRRKARMLMVMLALFSDGTLTRESLMHDLWPGQASSLARNALSTVLTCLRTTLGQKRGGPQYIVSAGDVLSLDAGLVDVDVKRFEHTARVIMACSAEGDSASLLDACSLVEGLFRSGFTDECDQLPRSAQRRMRELTALFVDCMVKGSDVAMAVGDAQLALWFARAAADIDGGREDVRRVREQALGMPGRVVGVNPEGKALPKPIPEPSNA